MNVEHLEVVTHEENCKRNIRAISSKLFCVRGHYRTSATFVPLANGRGYCLECKRWFGRKYYAEDNPKKSPL